MKHFWKWCYWKTINTGVVTETHHWVTWLRCWLISYNSSWYNVPLPNWEGFELSSWLFYFFFTPVLMMTLCSHYLGDCCSYNYYIVTTAPSSLWSFLLNGFKNHVSRSWLWPIAKARMNNRSFKHRWCFVKIDGIRWNLWMVKKKISGCLYQEV